MKQTDIYCSHCNVHFDAKSIELLVNMSFLWSQLVVRPTYPTNSYTGQTVIVTGSNVGLGKEAARHLARLGATKVILAVRNTDAGKAAADDIKSSTGRDVCEVWPLDLMSYESVKQFAARASQLPRLDVLLENAGVATKYFKMAEKDESTITVNVISTFLLALLLIPKLQATGRQFNTVPRLTVVTSEVHSFVKLPEWKEPSLFGTLSDEKKAVMASKRYPVTKLLEVFVVRAIAPKVDGVVLNMVNPGLCHSSLSKRESNLVLEILKFFLARSTEVGSRTLIHAASCGLESHGKYCQDAKIADEKVSAYVKSEEGQQAQKKVWSELKEKLETIQPGVTDVLGK